MVRGAIVDEKAPEPHEAAIANEQLELLLGALCELAKEVPESHFKVFIEARLNRRKIVEVAQELGIKAPTARKIVERLSEQLARIARRGGL